MSKTALPLEENEEELLLQAFDDAEVLESALSEQSLEAKVRDLGLRYQVKDLLGEGALKKVYLAYDELMDRDVALARMKADGHLEDFFNEARLASRLEHPYIAPIYDMGFDEEGQAFFSMKLYEGRNLYEELQSRNSKEPDLNWILNTFLKICEALAYAHGKGVLHLDIKPSNIRIDDFGEVLLCDWGISRIIGSESQSKSQASVIPVLSRATLIGECRGTPGFMAPEQKKHKSICDERTDVYGLGALLFDMLSGQVPEDKQDFKALKFPDEIKAICAKALENKAESRYNSVSEMMDDIHKYNQGLVILAENANSWKVFTKWVKRKKRLLLVLGGNLLLLFILAMLYIRNINQVNDKLEVTVTELKNEREDKEQEKLASADNYYKQGFEAYANSVSQFDYDESDITLATEMLIRAVELNPQHKAAWGLLGNLRVLQSKYTEGLECYSKADEKYLNYKDVLNEFLGQESRGIEGALTLIRLVDPLDDKRFRNHLIFKGIHGLGNKEGLFEFSLGTLAIVNNLDDITYKYDEETKTLDLKDNHLRTVYPLKTLRIEGLSLKGGLGRGHELYNLRNIPLRFLDLSYSKVVHLDRLLNVEIEELNLEGAPVKDIKRLEFMPALRKLNIYGIPAHLGVLSKCKKLEEVICLEGQAKKLKKILSPQVKLIIKP